MRQVDLPGGLVVPVLGQGTWRMGENPDTAKAEWTALVAGIEMGMNLIDTAEMYGEGATESFLGHVLAGRRSEVILVSKAYPQNGTRQGLAAACEASLKRLQTDRIDLYLLHWRGNVPLAETVEGMEALKKAGKICGWGVSNFDTQDMVDLIEAGGTGCEANQVLYNVMRRGPDFELVGWLKERGIALMAYSPVEQGRLPEADALVEVARNHGVTAFQVALAWTIRGDGFAIPKAADLTHVKANRAAADLALSADDLAAIDSAFPPPTRRQDLAML